MNTAHRLAIVTACAAFLLIVVGGLVTSTGSGDVNPDPVRLSHFSGKGLFENGHRVMGWTVGFLALLMVTFLLLKEKRVWVRRVALVAFGAIAAQGLLGMLTVKLELPAVVSIAHAGLAEVVFALLVLLAVVSTPGWTAPARDRTARAAVIVIYVQILLGAWLRHTGWTIALLLHLGMLLGVAAYVLRLKDAKLLHVLFGIQIVLGIVAVSLSGGKVAAAAPLVLSIAIPITAHVAVGPLMLAAAVHRALRAPREENSAVLATV